MAAALRDRLRGLGRGQASPLEGELKRATQATSIVVPADAVAALLRASSNEDDRRVIMRHLSCCLGQSASAQWRSVYLAMLVLEELLKNGPQVLVSETANGMHFDLQQRLSFLVNYEYSFDERVQGLVRKKALAMRTAWQQQQLSAMLDDQQQPQQSKQDVAEEVQKASGTVPPPPPPPVNLVDTDSDDEDWLRQPAVVYRKPVAATTEEINILDMQDDSTTDGSSTSGASTDPSPHPTSDDGMASNTLDLFSTAPAPQLAAAAATAPAAAAEAPAVDWLNVARQSGLFTEEAYAEDLCPKGKPPTAAAPMTTNLLDSDSAEPRKAAGPCSVVETAQAPTTGWDFVLASEGAVPAPPAAAATSEASLLDF